MKKYSVAALVFAVLVFTPHLQGNQRLAIRVSPIVSMAPAALTVRAVIEPSDENRRLNVTVDSDGYSTSSDIPLEGRSSARLSVIELKDVPSGLYEVRAVLMGPQGPLASSMQLVKVAPAVGRSR